MSAPQTNIDKQARRHRGPLTGMFAVVLFALILLGALALWAFRGGAPEGAATQVQSGLGTVETDESAVSANSSAEEERGAGSGGEPDPTAVTVPAETVTTPQTGIAATADTDPGESMNAEPLDPQAGAAAGEAAQD